MRSSHLQGAEKGQRRSFARRIAVGAVAAALVPILFALLSYLNFRANVRETREVARAREALTLATDLHLEVLDMERAIRVFRLTGEERHLERYRIASEDFEHSRRKLSLLIAGRPEQEAFRLLHERYRGWRTQFADVEIAALRRLPARQTAEGILLPRLPPELEMDAAKRAMDGFRVHFDAFEGQIQHWIDTRVAERERVAQRLSLLLWGVAAGSSLLLLAGTAWLFRQYRARAGILFAGLDAAERGEYRAVILPGKDEPARIAAAFNRTISEIERRDVELRHVLEEQRRLLTERTEALEARRASEGKLQAILDNTTSIIYVKDPEGRYLMVNRRFAEVFHADPEWVIGKTNFDVFPEEVARTFPTYDRDPLDLASPLEIEEVIPQDDGPHTYFSVKFPLRDEHGKVYGIAGISTDITQRKRAEEEINRFFSLALEGLCIAGFDGYFKRLNPVWEKMLGLSVAELQSKPFVDFVHPDDRAATVAESAKLFSPDHETVSFTNRYLCADGSYKWLIWNAKSDPVHKLIYAAARDVTQERLREEEIRELNGQLEGRVAELGALNHELEAFSYSVSHDLRAPLRHIAGFARMLEQSSGASLDEKGSRYLRTITDAAQRMGRLIDDLLLFSRMGRTQMTESSVDLYALALKVRQDMQSEIDGRDVVWRMDGLPEVRGDESMLRQVLVNLISNALKYTATRDRAEIEIGTSPNGGRDTIFFVRDNGVGFDMRYAHKLFGVFQRLHRAEEFEGTGVGLANVRRIIERHGGRTWADAELGRGATFYFSLPNTGGNS